ncbi:MAG: nitronate monooxygenase [Chloroflexi bacterium]|nr:nitronate monooxygenase [Chloroflexota bacterium]
MKSQQFCELLDIKVPIVQAPMAGGWTTAELVATVANARALGMIAAARLSVEQLKSIINATRQLTGHPFGINFLLAPPEPFDGQADTVQAALNQLREQFNLPPLERDLKLPPPTSLEEQLEIVLNQNIPVVSFAMGNPSAYVDRIHTRGALVFGTATTVEEAVELEQAGVDVIVVQGAEAGGHRSTFRVGYRDGLPLVGTMVLVPSVVDVVQRPVLASGGIMDGRGVIAALALGACGVQMGTRFLAAQESGAFPDYRQKILNSRDTDTVVTWQLTGRPARSIRNRFIQHLDNLGVTPLPWPYQAVAAEDIYRAAVTGNMGDIGPLLAGQGAGLAHANQSAAQVVAEVIAQVQQILKELTGAENTRR